MEQLSNKELVERVNNWVTELIKTGGRAWTLNIPARENSDPDFLITELCNRFTKLAEQPSPSPVEVVIATLEYYQGIIKGFADRATSDHERNICDHDFGNLTMAIKTIGMYKSFIDQAGPTPATSGETMRWVKANEKLPPVPGWKAIWREVKSKAVVKISHVQNDQLLDANYRHYKLEEVEWLDESASPSDTREEAIKFAEWLLTNTMENGDGWLVYENGYYKTAQLYDLYTQSFNN